MKSKQQQKRIVVIGGGTGTSTVVSGLKDLPVKITALISVADSGGSTGRLRDEFGFQPVGDLRQSLAALAKDESQQWIQKLLLYRFSKGEGLKGHNLGNLILTALQDMAGSTTSALEIAERIFQLRGEIYPVTTQNVQLVIEYADGTVLIGEDHLNYHDAGNKKIKRVRLSPKAKIYTKAENAIKQADMIVIGPGDYFTSLMPALCVDGIKRAFAHTKAKVVYAVNLMTRFNQTHGMTAKDHLKGIEQVIGRPCDIVLINNGKIKNTLLKAYEEAQEFPVENDMADDPRVVAADVVADVAYTAAPTAADALERSLLRHDADRLASILMKHL